MVGAIYRTRHSAIGLLGGVAAAGWFKVIPVLSTRSAAGAPLGDAAAASLLGLALIGATTGLVLLLAAGTIPTRGVDSPAGVSRVRPKHWVGLLVGVVAVAAAAVPYESTGLGRWGGPAGSIFYGDGGGVETGLWTVPTGVPFRINGLVDVLNRGHATFTIDSVDLVDATPGLHLVGAYALDILSPCADRVQNREKPFGSLEGVSCAHPVGGWRVGTAAAPGNQAFISLVIRADQPGRYRFRDVSVRYHVGPFFYTAIEHLGSGICVVPIGSSLCGGYPYRFELFSTPDSNRKRSDIGLGRTR